VQAGVGPLQRESSTNFAGFMTKENKMKAEATRRKI